MLQSKVLKSFLLEVSGFCVGECFNKVTLRDF